MLNQVINTIGLIFNIGGVVLLFLFGPLQPNLEEGVSLELEDGTLLKNGKTIADHNVDVRELRNRYKFFSRLALILIFVGFGLQLLATWVT